MLKIERVWAWVVMDPDGNEGIPAFRLHDTWFPLIGTDTERMMSLAPLAEGIALQSTKPLELRLFHPYEVVDQLPGGKK